MGWVCVYVGWKMYVLTLEYNIATKSNNNNWHLAANIIRLISLWNYWIIQAKAKALSHKHWYNETNSYITSQTIASMIIPACCAVSPFMLWHSLTINIVENAFILSEIRCMCVNKKPLLHHNIPMKKSYCTTIFECKQSHELKLWIEKLQHFAWMQQWWNGKKC